MTTTLIFDTETTGIANFKSSKHEDQPYPVQLACELVDDRKTISLFSIIVNPTIEIPKAASDVHGIDDKTAQTFGLTQRAAAGLFINLLMRCDRLCAHNIDFDLIITEAMIHRSGVSFDLAAYRKIPRVCTMQSTTMLLKLPGPYGHKWPKLDEAYKHLVDPNGFESAHDALADVRACKAVLFALEDGGHKLLRGKR